MIYCVLYTIYVVYYIKYKMGLSENRPLSPSSSIPNNSVVAMCVLTCFAPLRRCATPVGMCTLCLLWYLAAPLHVLVRLCVGLRRCSAA